MIRVHFVKAARPWQTEAEAAKRERAGIKVGMAYFWWNGGAVKGKQYSRSRPSRSRLTRTKWASVYAAEESLQRATDALELLNALTAAGTKLRKLKIMYIAPAGPGRRREVRWKQKVERLQSLIDSLTDFLGPVEDAQEPDADWAGFQQDLLDLDWNAPC